MDVRYTFTATSADPSPLAEPGLAASLVKWGLDTSRLRMARVRFDEDVQPYQDRALLAQLLDVDAVREALAGASYSAADSAAGAQALRTSWVDLAPLRRLSEPGERVARSSGALVQCFEDSVDGYVVADQLRRLLLLRPEDELDHAELAALYSQAERDELLFHLLRLVALGGPVNQYEDRLQPYRTAVRSLYRALVSVVKDDRDCIRVVSRAYRLAGAAPGAFAFVCIDAFQRTAAVLAARVA